MASPTNWPHPDNDPELYMRHQEKRIMAEQRRPIVRKASDILGPGFGPLATELSDWNSDEAAFNGYFWSAASTTSNAPDTTSVWMGICVSNGLFGWQQVLAVDPAFPVYVTRTWALVAGVRVYEVWT